MRYDILTAINKLPSGRAQRLQEGFDDNCADTCAKAIKGTPVHDACATGAFEYCNVGDNILQPICLDDASRYSSVNDLKTAWCDQNKTHTLYSSVCLSNIENPIVPSFQGVPSNEEIPLIAEIPTEELHMPFDVPSDHDTQMIVAAIWSVIAIAIIFIGILMAIRKKINAHVPHSDYANAYMYSYE